MSVCIAALAKGGTRMVIAVDRLGSLYGGTFEAEDTMTKGSTLVTARWTALFAGDDVSRALPVIQRAREALDALGTVPSRDKVADIMLREYQRERSALATEQHLSVYRMDMQEFLSNGGNIFGDAGFAAFRERIEQTALGCDFLCAGFNERGQGSIFSVEHPGVVKHFDSIGYWAIGSGAYNALSRLAIRGQKAGNSVVSTVYNVFEGKVAAESSGGVGKTTTIGVHDPEKGTASITDEGMAAIRAECERNLRPSVDQFVAEIVKWLTPMRKPVVSDRDAPTPEAE